MAHQILILAVPGVQLLDVSGPLDVFAEANRVLCREVYQSRIIALEAPTIVASSGVKMLADDLLESAAGGRETTFLIAGAPDAADRTLSSEQCEKITALCARSRRFGSVCTGALLLAQTGLLQGRKVTTHWSAAPLLAARYPETEVTADALYVMDGALRTAAGVTSGLDLALRLVEEDLGREAAQDVAARLVMFFKRPVNQTHFIREQKTSLNGRSALQDLQRWTIANIAEVTTVQQMAAHIHLSVRHLTRLFHQEIQIAPGEWLEAEKVAKARQLLESGELPVKAIPAASGFSGVDTLRRAFVRRMGITPAAYKKMC
ncbi:helix-turn-helix domain-containing protein [Enterobacter sp. Cy-643]|uniref:GlxA family transcriptional regulator n=1 Tax=Enterobacter sp. Cy-643 TaxID=2608346 RepID=UPI001423A774|nr:helix-turn-helix domain-containing protein [Enterobacter sp. Cy-643]NIF31728.1 helix-turn-helix domain-containing protein [Enterobacter sp. Cy-643]